MVFCEEVSDDELVTPTRRFPNEQSPFASWLSQELTSARDPSVILRDIGIVEDGVSSAETRLQLKEFASHSTYCPKACEFVRRRCLQLKIPIPFPFAVWLREREVNGATALQIVRALGMKPSEERIVDDARHWDGLKDLAKEDDAWEIAAKMAFTIAAHVPSRSARIAVTGIEDLARLISCKQRIMVLTGAGISASCGLPTFRDSNGWREAVAAEFGLSSPDDTADIEVFRRDPRPFFRSHKKILPAGYQPSPTHHFIRALEDRGKLLRLYTQNVDTLELSAGISRVTFCHGSFASATCVSCGHHVADAEEVNATIARDEIPHCHLCGAVMKPDVTLFGEPMPAGVREGLDADTDSADLLLVFGTSLRVAPCSLVPSLVGAAGDAPRILINKEPAGSDTDFEGFIQLPCDEAVAMLTAALGFPPDAAEHAAMDGVD